jgi:Beta-glucosidase-related glycosidases
MKSRLFCALAALLLICASSCKEDKGNNSSPAIPKDPTIEAKVAKTLKSMTMEEKCGQIVQLQVSTVLDDRCEGIDEEKLKDIIGNYKIGSLLNTLNGFAAPAEKYAEVITRVQEVSMEEIGIPCIYGLDMIHGASYLAEGTLFPQEPNIAATFNRENATAMGTATGYETRMAMVPWVFSPTMDLCRDSRWARLWESWGEDPYLGAEMSAAETLADQGADPNHVDLEHVAVSIKHYMGYGAPFSGKDRTPAIISPLDLREKYFEPFRSAIEAGALTVMVNSASINGIPTHANKELLTGWLKEGLNWDGMVVSDWADISNLFVRERIAEDKIHAIALAINAGVDMIMDPYDKNCTNDIKTAVESGLIPMSRIDDAVARILRLKYRLGLFDNPAWDISGYERRREDFKANALAAAVESEVLLKNEDNVLPIRKDAKILVTGPNANSMRSLNGGWSYTWQGSFADFEPFRAGYNTIYQALCNKFGSASVKYVPGVTYNEFGQWEEENVPDIAAAVAAARGVDVVVACVGENSYCETPGNTNDINLSANQKELVKAIAKTGKPIVLVLNEGRPRIISDIEPLCKAVVDIILPGNYGGDALAELLSGDENFSGRLPFTYPKYINSLCSYDYKVSEVTAVMDGAYNYDAKIECQWLFGDGLSYTTFEYSDLKVDKEHFTASDELNFEVTVKNTGDKAGREAVLLFSSDLAASVVPDNRRLREFDKIELQPGESKTVKLTIPASRLAFVGEGGKWRLEEGDFRISAGSQHLMVHCDETKVWNSQNIK